MAQCKTVCSPKKSSHRSESSESAAATAACGCSCLLLLLLPMLPLWRWPCCWRLWLIPLLLSLLALLLAVSMIAVCRRRSVVCVCDDPQQRRQAGILCHATPPLGPGSAYANADARTHAERSQFPINISMQFTFYERTTVRNNNNIWQ